MKAHARDLENGISACWSSRHEDASALKKLGNGFVASEDLNAKFSAYPDIYSGEFLSRMCQRIEDDIEIMTEQVQNLFNNVKDEAQYNRRDFAWRLILLGRVFDAVPRFKELVRMKINILLHTFLEMSWSFMFLFNLGMILEQSEWFQDDHMQALSRKNEDERIESSW